MSTKVSLPPLPHNLNITLEVNILPPYNKMGLLEALLSAPDIINDKFNQIWLTPYQYEVMS